MRRNRIKAALPWRNWEQDDRACVWAETEVVWGPFALIQRVPFRDASPYHARSQQCTRLTESSCLLRLEVVEAVTLMKHRGGSFLDQRQNGPVSAR